MAHGATPGTQINHPDLAANISPTYRYNWAGSDPSDPSPGVSDSHGTAVAGVSAAVGFNGIGVSGVAPSATIAPMRFLGTVDEDAEKETFEYGGSAIRVKNNSWGAGTISPTSLSSAEASALNAAANAGVVSVFAAGNALNVTSLVPRNGRCKMGNYSPPATRCPSRFALSYSLSNHRCYRFIDGCPVFFPTTTCCNPSGLPAKILALVSLCRDQCLRQLLRILWLK